MEQGQMVDTDEKNESGQTEFTSGEEKKNDSKIADLNADLSKKTSSEDAEFKSKFYYLAAEMENLKKRHQREIENNLKFGNEKLLKRLVEVVDNLERTITTISGFKSLLEDEKVKSMLQGIEMVRKQFLDVLSLNGLTPVESTGKMFNPNEHEALSQVEVSDKEDGTVVSEFQKGYILNGRLLRPAKVVVAKKVEAN